MGNDEKLIAAYPVFNETLRIIGAEGAVFGVGVFVAAILVVCMVRLACGFTPIIVLITVALIVVALVGAVLLMILTGNAIGLLDG